MKPLIFITNDDGYTAKGIHTLADALKPIGDLFIVAPDSPRSGAGCSVTSTVPVSCRHISSGDGVSVYACSGTPSDCTKLALGQLLVRQPDLIVSGINHGSNASVNVHYSGTVAAATEGALHGIPSIAFSSVNHDTDDDLAHLAPLCRHIVEMVMEHDLPFGTYLNVNFPMTEDIQGIRPCRLAYSRWTEEFEPCSCPRGGKFFWLAGENVNEEPNDDTTDLWALEHGYVAVTPVKTDPTDHELIAAMDDWDF
jgi:5'-nucleotidase